MPRPSEPTQELPARQAVLDHVARYRLTVFPAVRRLPRLEGYGEKRLRSLLRELCRDEYLGRASLYCQRPYFYLTEKGAAWLEKAGGIELANHQHGPLSELAKIHNYALLAFCLLSAAQRERLTCPELQRHFPALQRPGRPMSYYIDTTSGLPRLGFLRVDAGGHGRWDRVLAACRHDLEAHWGDPGFQPFIRRRLFEITLITALPQKALRLRDGFAHGGDVRTSIIRIVAIPELLSLIAPPLR